MRFLFSRDNLKLLTVFLVGQVLYWVILILWPSFQWTNFFLGYSFGFFVFVLIAYYLAYRFPGYFGFFLGLGLTLLILSLTLNYRWASGFSDNFLIGGLLPYKDAKNYFVGANYILNGIPLANAGQATERPLFPSLFSTLLMFTGQNLKVSIAILVNLVGMALYCSSRQVFRAWGAMAASLYSTLLLFYIQPWTGYLMSELFGFMMGCVAFAVLLNASKNLKWFDFVIGLSALIIAISARAGAFLILPMLMIWRGWVLRGQRRFSIRASIYTALIIVAVFAIVNILYPKLVGVPEGSSFGNFSYALYGQVRGGTGWHSAIEELGTRNPDVVYRAALQFFLEHPHSLLIAVAKSYRDFFLPGYPNIFSFDGHGQPVWLIYSIWLVLMGLLVLGLIRMLKNTRDSTLSLLLAGFIGMILSIPFLPPVDGGSRFYAGTVPFFFIVPAIGLSRPNFLGQESSVKEHHFQPLHYFALALIFFTIILPVFKNKLTNKTVPAVGQCPSPQIAFVIQVNRGSFIDLIQDEKTPCGIASNVCLTDFVENNSEFKIDDFYQEIHSMMKSTGSNIRLAPSINLINNRFHYFYIDSSFNTGNLSTDTLAGCASRLRTKNQSIFIVESISPIR